VTQPLSTPIPGRRSVHVKDLLSGGFFCGVAILYGSIALRDLPVGQVFNMGPGFFPLVLCGLLMLIGGALVLRSLFAQQSEAFEPVPWRAIALVSLGIMVFALLLDPLGLLLAVFFATLVASFAARKARLLPSILAAAAIAVFCVGVFVLGAQMQAPVFGSVFGG